MKRFLSALCASAIAMSVGVSSIMPAQAAPLPNIPAQASSAQLPVIEVQQQRREFRRELRRDRREFRRDRREVRRDFRQDRREARRDGYYRGHRGYREYRPGYKRHGNYWYPAAAFIAGAAISGIIANQQPRVVVREGNSHTAWCYDRYRSYRASDNTFQPYNGPRQQCYSPYS